MARATPEERQAMRDAIAADRSQPRASQDDKPAAPPASPPASGSAQAAAAAAQSNAASVESQIAETLNRAGGYLKPANPTAQSTDHMNSK